ncbi:MAG: hypothetical protein QQN63_04250 [Nitrosopumilus sp.]
MKIHGRTFSGPDVVPVVIPRSDGDVVFMCQAVLTFDDFEALCPVPEPPQILKPGNVRSSDPSDSKYLEALDAWGLKRTNWMILKSLEATDGLEWEQINMSDPETWDKFRTELSDCGFTIGEIGRLVQGVTEACGLNQERIDEATQRFLAVRAAERDEESSQNTAP